MRRRTHEPTGAHAQVLQTTVGRISIMLRFHRFTSGCAGLAAGSLLIIACSEAGTANAPLSDSTTLPYPSRPNPDQLTPPSAPSAAYQIDENGVILNVPRQDDAETRVDRGVAGMETVSDAGPDAAPAAGELTPDAGAQTLTELPAPATTPPPSEPPTNQGDEFNDPTPITASAGCDRGDPEPPSGMASLIIRSLPADYLVSLPDGYDGDTPLPLIFAFHGRARTFLEFEQIDATQIDQELGSHAIMVYPQAQGGEGWTQPEELSPSIEFFEALYQMMTANYCVDTSHVFAVGHSSGGFFSHILACRYGERLRGIGVVAGTLLENDCTGYVAALMIHGIRDSVVETSRGESARDFLLTRNGCTPDTEPGPDSHCVTYQGCERGLPVAWCEHDEPTYDDTNHGWPSFASHTIAKFLFSLP
jgi:poly(3-hydroxybutyrate) depolymerase